MYQFKALSGICTIDVTKDLPLEHFLCNAPLLLEKDYMNLHLCLDEGVGA